MAPPPDDSPASNPTEVVSPGEERFDRGRRTLGLFLGPAVGLLIALLPLPSLSAEAHRLAAILSLVVIYWMTEAIPIPVTALMGPLLCILAGVAPARETL
ncbi:MAG TPA: anion permease, partial [Nitrospiria bacterium]